MKIHTSLLRQTTAFSLVEVAMAVGIVSFCLLPIVGLVPIGLKSFKNANDQSAASNAVNLLSDALRNATTNGSGTYVVGEGFSTITWGLGSGSTNSFTNQLAISGQPTNSAGSRLVARVEIVPPADQRSAGRASISIAWPATATYRGGAWTNAAGFLSSSLQFLPKP